MCDPKIEVLIDIFTAELIRTLDRYGDLDTTVEIYAVSDRAIRALLGVQSKARSQAEILLKQAGCRKIEARSGGVSRKRVLKVDKDAWAELCREYPTCRDAQRQLELAQARVERLQLEYACQAVYAEIQIRCKEGKAK